MSYLHNQLGIVEPLVFADDSWTLATEFDAKCPTGGEPMRVKKTGQYPLPKPLQNPIMLLTGHGVQEQAQPCAVTIEFNETITRTGD
jgi:serine/threonine-protein kinase